MDYGETMTPTPNTIQRYPENLVAMHGPDWFDDVHDSVLILQDRDYEENGLPSQPQVAYYAA
jgi:hypothetical protein